MKPITRMGSRIISARDEIIENNYMLHYTSSLYFDAGTIDFNRQEIEVIAESCDFNPGRLALLKDISASIMDLMIKYGPDAKMNFMTHTIYVMRDETDIEVLARLRLDAWVNYHGTPGYQKEYEEYKSSLFTTAINPIACFISDDENSNLEEED